MDRNEGAYPYPFNGGNGRDLPWAPLSFNEALSGAVVQGLGANSIGGAAAEAASHPGLVPPSDYAGQLTEFQLWQNQLAAGFASGNR